VTCGSGRWRQGSSPVAPSSQEAGASATAGAAARRRPLDDVVIAGVLLDAGVPPGEDAEAAEHGRRYGRHEVVDLDNLADVEAVGEDEIVVVGVERHVAGAGRVGEAEVEAVVA